MSERVKITEHVLTLDEVNARIAVIALRHLSDDEKFELYSMIDHYAGLTYQPELESVKAELADLREHRNHLFNLYNEEVKNHAEARAELATMKQVVNDLQDGLECRPTCDSYGHADDCPVIDPAARIAKLEAERDAALDRNQQLENELAADERDEEKAIKERDEAQDALQQTHINLGGDGEWVLRIPAQEPPDSGDLHIDVPALALQVKADLQAANQRADDAVALLRQYTRGVLQGDAELKDIYEPALKLIRETKESSDATIS